MLSENLSSTIDALDIISQDPDNNIQYNQVKKIYIILFQFISSFLGLVSKPNRSWYYIYYLSHLQSLSVNCNIPKKFGKRKYTMFDNKVKILLKV